MVSLAWLWCCFGSRQKTRKPLDVLTSFDVDLEAGLVDVPRASCLATPTPKPDLAPAPAPEPMLEEVLPEMIPLPEDDDENLEVSAESVPLPEGDDEDLNVCPAMVPLPEGDAEDLAVAPELVPLPEDDDDDLEVHPELIPLPEDNDEYLEVLPELIPLPEDDEEDLEVQPEMVPLPAGDDEDLEVKPEMVPLPEDNEVWDEAAEDDAAAGGAATMHDDSPRLRTFDFSDEGVLGEGGWGKVHRAYHYDSGKMVAVKVMRKKKSDVEAAALWEQATLMVLSGGTNTLELLGSFHDHRNWYIVTPLYDGTIGDEMRKWGEIPIPLLKIYIAQLLLGLSYIHGHSIYHRDIKPENLFFNTSTHHVVIGDFGLAVTSKELTYRRSLTKEGQMEFVGTLEYMSREVWVDGQYSEASDVFAAGCVLFEGHLGRHLWRREDYKSLKEMGENTVYGNVDYWVGADKNIVDEEAYSLLKLMMDKPAAEVPPIAELLAHPFFLGVDLEALKRGEIKAPDVGDYPVDEGDSWDAGSESEQKGNDKTEATVEDDDDEDVCDPSRFGAGMFYEAGEDPLPEFNYTAEALMPYRSDPPPAPKLVSHGSSAFDLHLTAALPSKGSLVELPPSTGNSVYFDAQDLGTTPSVSDASLLLASVIPEILQFPAWVADDDVDDDHEEFYDSIDVTFIDPSELYTPTLIVTDVGDNTLKLDLAEDCLSPVPDAESLPPPLSPATTSGRSSPDPSEPYTPTLVGSDIDEENAQALTVTPLKKASVLSYAGYPYLSPVHAYGDTTKTPLPNGGMRCTVVIHRAPVIIPVRAEIVHVFGDESEFGFQFPGGFSHGSNESAEAAEVKDNIGHSIEKQKQSGGPVARIKGWAARRLRRAL